MLTKNLMSDPCFLTIKAFILRENVQSKTQVNGKSRGKKKINRLSLPNVSAALSRCTYIYFEMCLFLFSDGSSDWMLNISVPVCFTSERVGGAGDRGTQVGAGERGGGADFPRSELWKPLQPGRQVRHVLGQRGPLYHRICSEDSENTGHAGCVGKKSSEGSGTQSTQTVELSKLFLF